MTAAEFNKRYPVGTIFIHQPNKALRGGHAVKTVSIARQFKQGAIVEINVEPYFSRIDSLTYSGSVG